VPLAREREDVLAVEILLLDLDAELAGEREDTPLCRADPVRAQVHGAAVHLDGEHLAADAVARLEHRDRRPAPFQLPGCG
jgi:hypothetical protein